MLAKIREAQEKEEGFTLIELLVVVIIIGILAAIAIPAFLNQRERAWQAELVSDVRNAALDAEAAATANNGTYVADADFTVPAFAGNTTLDYVVNATGTDFCLTGTHGSIASAHSVSYQASLQGMQGFITSATTDCTLD